MSSAIWVVSFAFLCVGVFRQGPQLCQAQRQNVLLFAVDDLRAQINTFLDTDKPPFVHPPMVTPHLDALAEKSLVLAKTYVQFPLCNPSRTSVLTGRRPDTTRVYDLGSYWRESISNFTSLPEYFKNQGYETVGMGKIYHPGDASPNNDPPSWSRDYFQPTTDWDYKNFSWEAVSTENYTAVPLPDMQIKDKAIHTLRELTQDSNGKPFFIAVGLNRPHLPFTFPEDFLTFYNESDINLPENPYAPVDMPEVAWEPSEELLLQYDDMRALNLSGEVNSTIPDQLVKDLRRAYYASVTYIDHLIGEILTELEQLGLSKNTIIAFWGDHGFELGEHGHWCKNTDFELSAHAPLMIHIPDLTDGGVRSRELVEMVDLFPTLVEAAGLPPLEQCPENSTDITVCTEGESLLPLVYNTTEVPWKKRVFTQIDRDEKVMGYSMKTADFRYTEWIGFRNEPGFVPDWDDLIAVELYDHRTDWQEDVNRAEDPDYPEIRNELQYHLHRGWRYAKENA